MTLVGVPRETFPGERRVALVPEAVQTLHNKGLKTVVECGAGSGSGHADQDYEARGSQVVSSRADLFSAADALLQVRTLGANPQAGRADLDLIRPGQILIGFSEPLSATEEMAEVAARGATLMAMELVPRITRAQRMDALSSMATVAGYKAVLLAAHNLPRMFPLLMTAAGTVTPSRVLVIGAGVAGLQAISTARRLGAVVEAYDVRPAVREQVESLGARFVELDVETGEAEDADGYAAAQDEDFYRRQQEAMGKLLAEFDVVITTAAVPGKRAPVLITEGMVTGMTSGALIVDLAAERGGNCEATEPGETVSVNGVTVMGPVNVPSTIPVHASQMYGQNVSALLLHLLGDDDLVIEPEDEITAAVMVCHDGRIVHPQVLEQGDAAPSAV